MLEAYGIVVLYRLQGLIYVTRVGLGQINTVNGVVWSVAWSFLSCSGRLYLPSKNVCSSAVVLRGNWKWSEKLEERRRILFISPRVKTTEGSLSG